MTPAVAETLADAARDAREFAVKTTDAVQDAMRTAGATYDRGRRRVDLTANDVKVHVRQQPLTAVGVALFTGVVIGAAATALVTAFAGRCGDRAAR